MFKATFGIGLLVVASVVCTVSADAAKVTPVQKVIQLMEGMVKKGTDEKTLKRFSSPHTRHSATALPPTSRRP